MTCINPTEVEIYRGVMTRGGEGVYVDHEVHCGECKNCIKLYGHADSRTPFDAACLRWQQSGNTEEVDGGDPHGECEKCGEACGGGGWQEDCLVPEPPFYKWTEEDFCRRNGIWTEWTGAATGRESCFFCGVAPTPLRPWVSNREDAVCIECAEEWKYDEDDDGTMDVVGYDYNQDGEWDKFEELS